MPSSSSTTSARSPRRPRRRRPQGGKPQQQPKKRSLFDEVGVTAVDPAPFADLGLPARLVRALADNGMSEAFPIQAATIPDALTGRDVLGRGQTGSGKTLAFGLPLLAMQQGNARPMHPRGLVLVPTRELATQVTDSLKPLAKALGLYVREVVGGTSFNRQVDTLRRGVDVLVATPGRLADHVRQGTCVLSEVERTALDEADQMADMGFLPQVRELLDLVPADGQRLLFSATLDGDVDKLVDRYMTEPVVHSLAPPAASVDSMEHHQFLVSATDKQAVLARIGAREGRTIMFVRTKHHADRMAKKLRAAGVPAGALHGGKAQNARTRILEEFRSGETSTLVATNVAARGIHVDDVSLVVHVEPPADPKDYLHRAGRTARAGATGTVVTLVTDDQREAFRTMAAQAGVKAKTTTVRPEDAELARVTGAREPSGVSLAAPKQRDTPRSRGANPRNAKRPERTANEPSRRRRPTERGHDDGRRSDNGNRRGQAPSGRSARRGNRGGARQA
ncbi:Superfamily II DNA and RNA helicase [Saccharopolyspora kobensis]|uniref:Superfamily II DNA and RNA helicase n=1 Tax=Saccharopolyspora kobensis TaxID=146035 RepID=A0A1H6BUT5_9PSEU|nr:DEAD/DEAH box helicase [Saccharopolyspora kobensis]SEG64423.1 Superfamily II DNA and RNA helicase [Saccharopolyspora kobensis]SFC17190.1 Superfamily II DNA and RNA helicase [Saccharopolyspora kobensis]